MLLQLTVYVYVTGCWVFLALLAIAFLLIYFDVMEGEITNVKFFWKDVPDEYKYYVVVLYFSVLWPVTFISLVKNRLTVKIDK